MSDKRLYEAIVTDVVASALDARMIPANRLHLFPGIAPEPGIFAAVEALVALDGEITGYVAGKEAFKTARSVTAFLAVDVATRLEQGAASISAGGLDSQMNSRVLNSMRMARLLLNLDRKRDWFPKLTLERWVYALRRLNSGCSKGSKVITYGPDLLADIRSWLRGKPAKPTPKENEEHELLA